MIPVVRSASAKKFMKLEWRDRLRARQPDVLRPDGHIAYEITLKSRSKMGLVSRMDPEKKVT